MPVTTIDDFQRGNEWPKQQRDDPRADDYQSCNPSTVH
jgi:hypothetical protein